MLEQGQIREAILHLGEMWRLTVGETTFLLPPAPERPTAEGGEPRTEVERRAAALPEALTLLLCGTCAQRVFEKVRSTFSKKKEFHKIRS